MTAAQKGFPGRTSNRITEDEAAWIAGRAAEVGTFAALAVLVDRSETAVRRVVKKLAPAHHRRICEQGEAIRRLKGIAANDRLRGMTTPAPRLDQSADAPTDLVSKMRAHVEAGGRFPWGTHVPRSPAEARLAWALSRLRLRADAEGGA